MTEYPATIDQYLENISALRQKITARNSAGVILSLADATKQSIALIRCASQDGGKIIFIGNGGSAAIASHMAIDFSKNGGMPAVCFNDGVALTCLTNDLGYEEVFSQPIRMLAKSNDVLVAISSSGQSRNIINAVKAAHSIHMKVITLSGFDEANLLVKEGNINFHVPSDRYGAVEITHLTLCHALLDLILGKKAV